MDLRPVYIFTGFLDSGKTTSIKNTLLDPRFTENEKTLICVFEQGDVEYDSDFLKKTNSVVEYLDFALLTPEVMRELDQKYKPDRVFIELNGMDNGIEFFKKGMIKGLEVAQILTTIDGSKFKVNMNNLKQFFYNHISISELAIINRSDGQDLRYFRNNLKGINQKIQILYEDIEGNVSNKIEDNYFDLSKPIIVNDADFGIWYMDLIDNQEKYDNVDVTVNGYYYRVDDENPAVMGFGRKAMVCCSNDLQEILFPVYYDKDNDLKMNKYYTLHGTLHLTNTVENTRVCIFYLEDYKPCKELDDSLVYFN